VSEEIVQVYEKKIEELTTKRAQLVQGATLVIDTAKAESRDLTEEEQAAFDAMMGQADAVAEEAATEERSLRAERAKLDLQKKRERVVRPAPGVIVRNSLTPQSGRMVLRAWALGGKGASLDTFHAAEAMGVDVRESKMVLRGTSTQSVGSAALGGNTVPDLWSDSLIKHLKYVCPIRTYCQTITTTHGDEIHYPISDDTGATAQDTSESEEVVVADSSFVNPNRTLRAWKRSSSMRITRELLQDSAFNLEEWIKFNLLGRIGRRQAQEFIAGTGTNEANGIVTNATIVENPMQASYDDLVKLVYSIDGEYLDGSVFIMSKSMLRDIRRAVDSSGRPLWEMSQNAGMENGQPSRLLGYPVIVSDDVPYESDGDANIVFGNLSQYIVRDVGGVELVRSEHEYARLDEIAFYAHARADGNWFGPTRALSAGAYTAAS
jgi:HK97 family phage major capsid protein